jgi:hypothetical protein
MTFGSSDGIAAIAQTAESTTVAATPFQDQPSPKPANPAPASANGRTSVITWFSSAGPAAAYPVPTRHRQNATSVQTRTGSRSVRLVLTRRISQAASTPEATAAATASHGNRSLAR